MNKNTLPEKPQNYVYAHALNWEHMEKNYGASYTEDTLSVDVLDLDGSFLFKKTRNLNANKENGESKYKNEYGSHAALFNYSNVKDQQTVVICEGEMDCIQLSQQGIPAVTSTSGAGNFDPKWAKLLADKKVYICLDNDDAGKKGVKLLLELFPDALIITLPNEFKDICDFFAAGNSVEDLNTLIAKSTNQTEWNKLMKPADFNILSNKDFKIMKFDEMPYLIKGVLYAEGFCFIYGAEGTGKSLLALDIAKSLVLGRNWLNQEQFEVNKKINVLILDKENSKPMIQKRLNGMGLLDIDDERIFYLEFPEKFQLSDGKGGYSEFAKSVADTVNNRKVGLIIIDSFVDFIVGNESSSEDTQDFFSSIKELYPRIAYLALHHENKPSQGVFRNDSQRLRGSSNISAQLVTGFRLESVAKSKDEITLKQIKARDSRKLDKFGLRMVIKDIGNNETIVTGFEYMGNSIELVDSSKSNEVRSMIDELLKAYKCISRKQVLELGVGKGISEGTVRIVVKEMLEDGSINETKKGKEKWYSLGMFTKTETDYEDLVNEFDGSVPTDFK